MTTHLLRVLLVEDSEDDALLTLLELRKGGFHTEWERVDTRVGMERAVPCRVTEIPAAATCSNAVRASA